MMNPRVYIETTIVSYLTAWPSKNLVRRAHQQVTQTWWRDQRHLFELCTSQFVLDEAAAGDPEAARLRLEALDGLPMVDVADAGPLAERLLGTAALPPRARIDAFHLAAAAVNGVDYLCTWNCRHLANATLRRKIEAACRDLGVEPPIICTPDELSGGEP